MTINKRRARRLTNDRESDVRSENLGDRSQPTVEDTARALRWARRLRDKYRQIAERRDRVANLARNRRNASGNAAARFEQIFSHNLNHSQTELNRRTYQHEAINLRAVSPRAPPLR